MNDKAMTPFHLVALDEPFVWWRPWTRRTVCGLIRPVRYLAVTLEETKCRDCRVRAGERIAAAVRAAGDMSGLDVSVTARDYPYSTHDEEQAARR
jgi:hypothetical protein